MFENSPHPNYRIAVDKDDQGRIVCAIQSASSGSIVATGCEGELTFHVPKTKEAEAAITKAAGPWFARLEHEGQAA